MRQVKASPLQSSRKCCLVAAVVCSLVSHSVPTIRAALFPLQPAQFEPGAPPTREAPGDSFAPAVSGDGRYVAFLSFANNLMPNDANQGSDVFLKDRETGQLSLISINAEGTGPGNEMSFNPTVSDDGRFVLFESRASDLVMNDTNNAADVFLRDVVDNITHLISRNDAGTGSANGESRNATMTREGILSPLKAWRTIFPWCPTRTASWMYSFMTGSRNRMS